VAELLNLLRAIRRVPVAPGGRIIRKIFGGASMDVRERAGCSLTKSGMLTREQRMKAVPGQLELTDDTSLDAITASVPHPSAKGLSTAADSRLWTAIASTG